MRESRITSSASEGRAAGESAEELRLLAFAAHTGGVGAYAIDLENASVAASGEALVARIRTVPEHFRDRSIDELLPSYQSLFRAAIARCAKDGEPFEMDVELVPSATLPRWLRVTGRGVRDEQRLVRVEGVFRDLTAEKRSESAREDGEQRMQALIDALPLLVCSAGADRKITSANQRFFSYTGVSPDAVNDQTWASVVHPADLQRIRDEWNRSLDADSPLDAEVRIRNAHGEYRWFRANSVEQRSVEGELRWYITATDIHQSKLHEEAATRIARRLSHTLDSLTDGFIALNADWEVSFANNAAANALRVTHEELAGRSLWSALPAFAGTEIERTLRAVKQSGNAAAIEAHYAPLGRWFDLRAYPSDDRGIVLVLADITERLESMQQLRDLATLLDHAHDAIFVQDAESKLTYWNHGAERLLGYPRDEVLGRNAEQLLRSDPREWRSHLQHVVDHGSWSGEFTLYTAQGRPRIVSSRWSTLRSQDGAPNRVLVINKDITERKERETQLFRAQRLESIGTLAGGIAHDLNNVLTPIITSVSLLRTDETDPDKLEMLALLEQCAQRGADMVRRLLTFARGNTTKTMSDVDISAVGKDVLRIIRESVPKTIQCTLVSNAPTLRVRADPTQMHQLLMNLCVNACDAMPNGGALTIMVNAVDVDEVFASMTVGARAGRFVALEVIDTGAGIPPELQEKIFDPFFTTKEPSKGTGLGLSTCHSIVQAHQGFISLYSELGRGTRFKVFFPAVETEAMGELRPSLEAYLPRGAGETILLVDDEESIRKLTSRTLERFGYRVLTASNGAEAVAMYAQHRDKVAIVLTDLSMPVMDGHALIVALRSMNPGLKIFASSGLDTSLKFTASIPGDPIDLLEKPYSADALLRALRRVLD